jgi:hypothetical protein
VFYFYQVVATEAVTEAAEVVADTEATEKEDTG